LDDLVGYAGVGAAEALRKWDGRGSFEGFAIQRIRWAILQGIRAWLAGRPDGAAHDGERALLATETAAESIDQTPEERSMTPRELSQRAAWAYRLELSLAEEEARALADPDQDVEHDSDRLRVRRAIARLPPPEDQVLQRHCYQHESFQEIASALAMSKSTVGDAYARAVRRLQEWLEQADRAPAPPGPRISASPADPVSSHPRPADLGP
jgi:RNA polymerase sigma factor (sigma-70 family)